MAFPSNGLSLSPIAPLLAPASILILYRERSPMKCDAARGAYNNTTKRGGGGERRIESGLAEKVDFPRSRRGPFAGRHPTEAGGGGGLCVGGGGLCDDGLSSLFRAGKGGKRKTLAQYRVLGAPST